jgi:hypothetical protein
LKVEIREHFIIFEVFDKTTGKGLSEKIKPTLAA